jgi:hypothetical protein
MRCNRIRHPAALAPRPRRNWREFVVTTSDGDDDDSESDRHKGFGLGLDDVIARELFYIADALAHTDKDDTPAEFADRNPDRVIWEDDRVLAVIRSLPGEAGPEVVRFDGEPRAYIATLELPAEPEPDERPDTWKRIRFDFEKSEVDAILATPERWEDSDECKEGHWNTHVLEDQGLILATRLKVIR